MPKADFTQWSREGLEEIARQLVDENNRLREDNKALLSAWRKLVTQTGQAEAPAGLRAQQSLFQSQQQAQAMVDGASQSGGPSTSR